MVRAFGAPERACPRRWCSGRRVPFAVGALGDASRAPLAVLSNHGKEMAPLGCLLYTSDAADDLLCVDLGGRRIIKKKNKHNENIMCVKLHR